LTTVIEVQHLAHRYGRRTIYEDLNFSVPSGKIIGLLGKNGVGKTTLIKILMGFLRPAGGIAALVGLLICCCGYIILHWLRRRTLPERYRLILVAVTGIYGLIAVTFIGSET
jgi:ABC-type transporter Mla maintaining outer membrane lipid asymmetry ATPase subunit MlaF